MRCLMLWWVSFRLWQTELSIELVRQQVEQNLRHLNQLREKQQQLSFELHNLEEDRP